MTSPKDNTEVIRMLRDVKNSLWKSITPMKPVDYEYSNYMSNLKSSVAGPSHLNPPNIATKLNFSGLEDSLSHKDSSIFHCLQTPDSLKRKLMSAEVELQASKAKVKEQESLISIMEPSNKKLCLNLESKLEECRKQNEIDSQKIEELQCQLKWAKKQVISARNQVHEMDWQKKVELDNQEMKILALQQELSNLKIEIADVKSEKTEIVRKLNLEIGKSLLKMPGKCSFKEEWISKSKDYDKWLHSHSGYSSLKVHERRQKHQELTNALLTTGKLSKIFFTKDNKSETSQTNIVSNQISSDNNIVEVREVQTLNSFIVSEKVARAEIMWALNKVMCTLSDRGATKSSSLFKHMFPDSLIAEKFSMQKDKLGYMVSYGLGPYFQKLLCDTVKDRDYFCIAIDESLNKIAQKCQMDLRVRFWNAKKNEVSTYYLTSMFLGHSTSCELLINFISAIKNMNLCVDKLLQIEMDGPNGNLKFFCDLQNHLSSEKAGNELGLIDTGTCCLHVVHGAYKYTHSSSGWNISSFLCAIYYLFKDFPSRRVDFIHHTGYSSFPLKMCAIRWLENSDVINRAVELLPYLQKYVDAVSKDPPKSENFHKVKMFLNSKFLKPKLFFLQSIASELEPFLCQFQADKPLLPFLYTAYYKVMHSIASHFLKKEVILSIKNAKQLLSFDFENPEKHLHVRDIDIDVSALLVCKKLQEGSVLDYRRDCKNFLTTLFTKLVKKSPLTNNMVKGASCLSPLMLSTNLKEVHIKYALDELVQKNILSGIEADNIKKTYFNITEDKTFRQELNMFSVEKDRLDTLFMKLKEMPNFSEKEINLLLKFAQILMIMYHGNAAVERGFSVNKECLVENLHEESLISQRCVHSAVTAAGGILSVDVSKSMLAAVRNASFKRKEALEKKRKDKEEEESNRKSAAEKIRQLQVKRKMLLLHAEEEAEALQAEIKNIQKKLKI